MKLVKVLLLGLVIGMLLWAACGGGEPEELVFDMEIQDGELVGEKILKVKEDDQVILIIQSDDPGTFHIHGYDLDAELTSDETAELVFTVHATGKFDFELHRAHEG